jgi:hypothetical protein
MRFRQVHLDFHTSECIEGIGENFSAKQFQEALTAGNVNSINLFAKCHHGWSYHPTQTNAMHPHLKFDLFGAQMAAAREIGVATQAYISAGLDEKEARQNRNWLIRQKDQRFTWAPDFESPGYHVFCFNTPYLEKLMTQIDEVIRNYDPAGAWLDIASVRDCWCGYCMDTLAREGKDFNNDRAVRELAERVYANYTRLVRETVDAIKPGLPVFHNGGHIVRGRRDLARMNTHLDIESLPTGGWGYDHFPLSARYAATLGMAYTGATGKFHTSWGEFGGFKHPNALRYEAALSVANGARCCIGDQLAPDGAMDPVTYRLIGAAYQELEAKEPWLDGVSPVADIALLSAEAACATSGSFTDMPPCDLGAVRILLEGKYLFNVIDAEEDYSQYKVIILPDVIEITESLQPKLTAYTRGGGKLLATGKSGLGPDGFAFDFGARHTGPNPYKPDYFRPGFDIKGLGLSDFIFYADGEKIERDGGMVHGERIDPYFNREAAHFCSHQHTPSSGKSGGPGMTEGRDGIYIAWNIFEDYAHMGSLAAKKVVCHALDILLGDNKTLETDLPAQGTVTFAAQENRYVNHLLYASPVLRGRSIQVIEDIVPVSNVRVRVRPPKPIRRVTLAPQGTELPFTQKDGVVEYTVPSVECHQMVVLE